MYIRNLAPDFHQVFDRVCFKGSLQLLIYRNLSDQNYNCYQFDCLMSEGFPVFVGFPFVKLKVLLNDE